MVRLADRDLLGRTGEKVREARSSRDSPKYRWSGRAGDPRPRAGRAGRPRPSTWARLTVDERLPEPRARARSPPRRCSSPRGARTGGSCGGCAGARPRRRHGSSAARIAQPPARRREPRELRLARAVRDRRVHRDAGRALDLVGIDRATRRAPPGSARARRPRRARARATRAGRARASGRPARAARTRRRPCARCRRSPTSAPAAPGPC